MDHYPWANQNQMTTSNMISNRTTETNDSNSYPNEQKKMTKRSHSNTKVWNNVSNDVKKMKLTPKPATVSIFKIEGKRYSPKKMTLHEQHPQEHIQKQGQQQQQQYLQHEQDLQHEQHQQKQQCSMSAVGRGSLTLTKVVTKPESKIQKPKSWPQTKVEVLKTNANPQNLISKFEESKSSTLNEVIEVNPASIGTTGNKPEDSGSNLDRSNGTKRRISRTAGSINRNRLPCKSCSFVSRNSCKLEFHVFYNHLSVQVNKTSVI